MRIIYEWPAKTPSNSKLVRIYNKVKTKLAPSKMSAIPIDPNDDKQVLVIHPDNLPDANHDHMAKSLSAIVDHSATNHDLSEGIHAHSFHIIGAHWIHGLIPGLHKLENKYHVGNFVVVRETGEKVFESMPIYARIGMHLLFYGKEQVKILETHTVEHLLQQESIKEGKTFDSPESVKSIPGFIKTYHINMDELLHPDLKHYKNFNEFFYRKLLPGARPVQNPDDLTGFCSAADCRLTVFDSIDLAKEFWIKGKNFTIPNLLGITPEEAQVFDGASIAIFRLAPADYHRFHCPLDGVVGDATHLPGQYYTVNPQAINEPGFDVFTANTRSVLTLTHTSSGKEVAFCAIGALLVGSIRFTVEKDQNVKRGDELGYFAYGGSTVVCVFPKDLIEFDADLVKNSSEPVETLMKAGWSIGHVPKK